MTKTIQSLALVLCMSGVVGVATSSCSKSGGSSSPTPAGTLHPGTYDFGTTDTTQDNCGEGDRFNGLGTATVVMAMLSPQTVIFGGLGSYVVYNSAFTLVSGTTYGATLSLTADFSTTALQNDFIYRLRGFDAIPSGTLSQGYNCVQTFDFAQSFGIDSPTSVTFLENDTITVTSGDPNSCIGVDTSAFGFVPTGFPCNTTESAVATF